MGSSGAFPIPEAVWEACSRTEEGRAWLARLPELALGLARRWSLELGSPIESDATSSWVAVCRRSDGETPVLKIALPHMEARDEAAGLRFWDGAPFVRLLDAAPEADALLLERCAPGVALNREAPETQDRVLVVILRELWRPPPPDAPAPFRPLAEMIDYWCECAAARPAWCDPGLQREGMQIVRALAAEPGGVLLATDLHAGNVLSSERLPWLAIDPKPFVGDPTYDATQHLRNHHARLAADPLGWIARFAEQLEIDAERLRLWTFGRLTIDAPRDVERSLRILKALTPG